MALSTLKRKIAIVAVLNEINDFSDEDDERNTKRGPDRIWIRERETKGAFAGIFTDLSLTDPQGFRRFMRMDIGQFNELTNFISREIAKEHTKMRKPISPGERLALTLRFLATGESFRSLEFQFRISRKAISYIVTEVATAIYNVLGKDCLKFPTECHEWQEIECSFADRWNFPHCVGAVDGKHVTIQGCGLGSQYYNYKGTHSIIMLLVAGPNYEVIWADVGVNGRVSDGAVLKRSKFGTDLEDNLLNLPSPTPLPGRTSPVPYVFIGDDAFALRPNFMKPYAKANLDLFTRICNYRFSRGRRISENLIGILANRWQVLHTTISLHPRKVRQICLAILTLHNWLLRNKSVHASYLPPNYCDRIDPTTQRIVPGRWRQEEPSDSGIFSLQPIQHGSNPSQEAKRVREEFKEYFSLEGAVPWQWEYCMSE